MVIRPARPSELETLRDIERAAGACFRDIGMPEIADDEPPPVDVLTAHQRLGEAWVTVDEADRPAAYLISTVIDGCLHIDQVSVHPDHARRGIGSELIDHAASRATRAGLAALTLTTFAEVPWNAPYYRRCGFRILAEEEITAGLRAIRNAEAGAGLDRWTRVCMRREVLPRPADVGRSAFPAAAPD